MIPEEALLADISRYGLVVAPVAGRLLGVHTHRARRLLESLVRSGAVRRYRFDGASYFTARKRPLPAAALRARFAISWFCHMTSPPTELLDRAVLREVLSPVAAELGLRHPRNVPAYLNRVSRRVSALIVGREGGSEAARVHLERVLSKRWFRPWAALAAAGHAEVTYLQPGEEECAKLSLGLKTEPLRSLLPAGVRGGSGEDAAVVPVRVAPLRALVA